MTWDCESLIPMLILMFYFYFSMGLIVLVNQCFSVALTHWGLIDR